MGLSIKDKLLLKIQKFLGNIAFLFIGNLIVFYFRFVKRYSISNLKNIRKFYKNLIKENIPIMICPNHLTMVDSVIIQWALANNFFYFFHFSKLPWNIPAKENVQKNILFRFIAYFSKCILIDRKGTKEHKEKVLRKLIYLLSKKEPICIFIEGTRSINGKLLEDQINYGAGQIFLEVPKTKILVIYLRGKHQKIKSDFPQKGEDFFLKYQIIQPLTFQKGLRAQKDITYQILKQLKEFENEYFSFYQ
jgi:1-acyl-sn-glycerol-3-phosphate acyltransferase